MPYESRRHPAEFCKPEFTAEICCSERHPRVPKGGTYTLYIRWGWTKPQRDWKNLLGQMNRSDDQT